ncbi:uroporphyrinogen decarboxylase [Acetobacterium paludosum]|uniref:Uroporphyrinogen decarboxylase n=1 Tax=Acetobacterium paludosum TaxID=52693 RepID=A0A923HWB1_9FIRM|nr:uroporphyrinogen decarboxylase family protein [Acetobacterium paludosum]MBC3889703.1 uroporphyrinogen decarboxylase [Acetobacterium paludosum]
MYKEDLMTPVERAQALAKGESVDRMPISMFYGAPGHSLLGWTRRQEVESGRSLADVQEKIYEVFGGDGVSASYGLHGMAVNYGAKMTNPEHQQPAILEPPIKSIADLSTLDLDRFTIENDPTAKKCFDAVRILRDEVGNEVTCGMMFSGAFTSASALVGAEQLLKALHKNPEQVHKLLKFTAQAIQQMAKPFLEEGFGVSIADPVASGTIITKKMFQQFVVPYSRKMVEMFEVSKPGPVLCHICGDTTKVLEEMVDCGYKVLSLDNVVDLAVAKEKVGDKVFLVGNVDPIGVIHLGTPEEVKMAVRECCKKAWNSPGGFMISTGCDSAYGTPMENSLAFMQEARKCAKYPMNPDNFQ